MRQERNHGLRMQTPPKLPVCNVDPFAILAHLDGSGMKSRKRFVKIMHAAFGVQRNAAEYLAEKYVKENHGRFSYKLLWIMCRNFLAEKTAAYILYGSDTEED